MGNHIAFESCFHIGNPSHHSSSESADIVRGAVMAKALALFWDSLTLRHRVLFGHEVGVKRKCLYIAFVTNE